MKDDSYLRNHKFKISTRKMYSFHPQYFKMQISGFIPFNKSESQKEELRDLNFKKCPLVNLMDSQKIF